MPHNGEQRDTNDNRTGFNSVNLTLLSDTTQKSQGIISPSQLQLSIEDADANCHGIDSSSYKSIYDKMKNAKEISSGRIDFFKRVIAMFYNSYAWAVPLVLFAVLSVVIVVFGSLNIGNCSQEPLIPVYLIGFGAAWFCKLLLFLTKALQKKDSNLIGEKKPTRAADWRRFLQIFLSLFLITWFILGNVWVYRLYKNFYYFHSENYGKYDLDCDKTVYLVAFWIVNSTYAIFMCGCTCYWLCSCIMGTL